MLETAIGTLSGHERLAIQRDRGGQYRWPGWVQRKLVAGCCVPCRAKGALQSFCQQAQAVTGEPEQLDQAA